MDKVVIETQPCVVLTRERVDVEVEGFDAAGDTIFVLRDLGKGVIAVSVAVLIKPGVALEALFDAIRAGIKRLCKRGRK